MNTSYNTVIVKVTVSDVNTLIESRINEEYNFELPITISDEDLAYLQVLELLKQKLKLEDTKGSFLSIKVPYASSFNIYNGSKYVSGDIEFHTQFSKTRKSDVKNWEIEGTIKRKNQETFYFTIKIKKEKLIPYTHAGLVQSMNDNSLVTLQLIKS